MAITPNNYPFNGGAFINGSNAPVEREDIHTLTLTKGNSSLGQYNPLISDTSIGIPSDASDDTSTFTKASGDTSSMASGSKLSAIFTAISSFFASIPSNFKTKQTAVADPTVDGTGLSFIDSITQNINGEIVPHKKTVQNGTTAQKGVVQLQDSIGSTESTTDKAVTPHAVRAAIDAAVSSAYHAAGTKTVSQLTDSLLIAANEGSVYNMTDSGTTTRDFVDGAGHPINAGDNVVVCDVGGGVYKFDLLSGFVDLSNYLTNTGDASDTTSTFTKASGDTSSMTSGSKLSAIFGAISSSFASLKALAFKDKASYTDLSSGVQSSLDKADTALQAAVEYVTTSSTWQTLETAYNAGKTLILKVENGTNWFDEYRIIAVNKSSGSDRFIFCGFPTMVNLVGGSVESLEVTEWICYLDGSTTRWVTTIVDGLKLPTKDYVEQVAATKVEFIENTDSSVIGNDAPCADCKTYFANNVTAGRIKVVYNRPGNGYTLIFSKQSNGNYGNILKYGYADRYLRIMRYRNGNWESGNDWEKIGAGYADSAENAVAANHLSAYGHVFTWGSSKYQSGTPYVLIAQDDILHSDTNGSGAILQFEYRNDFYAKIRLHVATASGGAVGSASGYTILDSSDIAFALDNIKISYQTLSSVVAVYVYVKFDGNWRAWSVRQLDAQTGDYGYINWRKLTFYEGNVTTDVATPAGTLLPADVVPCISINNPVANANVLNIITA